MQIFKRGGGRPATSQAGTRTIDGYPQLQGSSSSSWGTFDFSSTDGGGAEGVVSTDEETISGWFPGWPEDGDGKEKYILLTSFFSLATFSSFLFFRISPDRQGLFPKERNSPFLEGWCLSCKFGLEFLQRKYQTSK
ncbi:MAG: hypothetical protein UW07_C0036G0004 [Candidatus Nomurabacteria bacterium GW2011_GWF2_43_8]|uniref:Uncharacterized protein n=3 Tax=Candidatus Nomuraibacteriota TaxID=1752729 RepID=A0A0G1FJ62_9BACT|nr:MAG: hypothetical protein UV76_C0011G0030 [Candidatus Nomurabacteria bacterium GW2011_GWA2_43_15]KKT19070.1 MAG: hypothetical protein UW02_C0016G0044 [Candidatus Nomurabacteria bacterium GW2011_GWB1_43_7]KKT22435.1 MAG: hypothetical protein UW07_C0036G0004 [Candidatus Nomurabacteria bacterium GW2011_GWF2_43_8]